MFTRSTLPVRSPLPNRQPSMRSAPAISANSPAAVPVPRSLCGCTDSTIESRRARWRCIHSIMSAKMLGVLCSTVDGRLMMHLRSGVGCQTSVTASTTRLEKASSVPENISGEYWKVQLRVRLAARRDREPGARAWSPARRCRLRPARARRAASPATVALYRCTIARLAPVQRLEGALDQFGRAPGSAPGSSRRRAPGLRSISRRTKSNSVCDAEGKPTSISLKPIFTSISNMRSLRSLSIGSISAWLPSRRSTLHQTGAWRQHGVGPACGRSSCTGAKGRYLVWGCFNMAFLVGSCSQPALSQNKRPAAGCIRAV